MKPRNPHLASTPPREKVAALIEATTQGGFTIDLRDAQSLFSLVPLMTEERGLALERIGLRERTGGEVLVEDIMLLDRDRCDSARGFIAREGGTSQIFPSPYQDAALEAVEGMGFLDDETIGMSPIEIERYVLGPLTESGPRTDAELFGGLSGALRIGTALSTELGSEVFGVAWSAEHSERYVQWISDGASYFIVEVADTEVNGFGPMPRGAVELIEAEGYAKSADSPNFGFECGLEEFLQRRFEIAESLARILKVPFGISEGDGVVIEITVQ